MPTTDLPEVPTSIDPEQVERERAERDFKSRRDIDYACGKCGRSVGRDNLKVKRVQFREMGVGAAVVKTRTVAWLCVVDHDDGSPGCLFTDEDWQRERMLDAPGMKDSRAERE